MKKKIRNSSSLSDKDKYLIVKENTLSGRNRPQSTVIVQSFYDTNNAFKIFLDNHSCYDLVPDSSKLVVFDNSLNVQKAFYALIYNGVRAAVIWDSSQQSYVGLFTITDFIKILRGQYQKSGPEFDSFQQLEQQDIALWRAQSKRIDTDFNELVCVSPESSLKDAVEHLLRRRVHRLPVIDGVSGNPLHIITHKRILKYLYMNLYHLPAPSFLGRSIGNIPIGTFGAVYTVRQDQPIIDAFNLFIEKRVSALPVVDANGTLIDIYSKFDAINLAATRTYHQLDKTIGDAMQYREKKFPDVATCSKTDTLQVVMDLFHTYEVHRLVIVDSNRKVEGVLSLSDILEFFIRTHPSDD